MKPVTTGDNSAVLDLGRAPRQELASLGVLFKLTLRQYLHGRRMLVLLALSLLPCALAALIRSLNPRVPPETLEFALVFNLIPHGLAPLTALLYAAGMIQDEVEDQTLTYLLLRPLPRWGIYVTKLLATLVTTTVLIAAATAALYFAVYWGTAELWGTILPTRVLQVAAIFALAQIGYCTLFGFIGLLTRRALIAGIGYIVLFEAVLANLEFVIRVLTVVYYARALAIHWLDLPQHVLDEWKSKWSLDKLPILDADTCVLTLLVFGVVAAGVAAYWFGRREFRMKTPEGS